MYRSLKEVKGYKISASDGEIGNVADFLFDQESWTVRYLVIETGSFFRSRAVLLSPRFFKERPDWTTRILPVNLTMEQVKSAPDIDTAKPLYRQKEAEFNKYYRLSDYWVPLGSQPQDVSQDTSIRSFTEVSGYHVHANDGSIGSVIDFIINDEKWTIQLLVIDIGSWHPGRKVVLSPLWTKIINWYTRSVQFDMSKEQIKNAPTYDPMVVVDRMFEETLYSYYNKTR